MSTELFTPRQRLVLVGVLAIHAPIDERLPFVPLHLCSVVGSDRCIRFGGSARAKGLGTRAIVTRHALRNAAIPIVTTAGTQLGYLLGGAVLTETIFSWPGLGRYVIESIDTQDIKPLQGSILFIAVVFILVNLLVDLSYALLDPRVRKAGGSK
mgnify:CR=1 FL=1